MLVSLFIGLFLSKKKKKLEEPKKKKVLSKNHIFKPKAKSKQIQKKCPSINHIYLHYNLDKKIIIKKIPPQLQGKHSSASRHQLFLLYRFAQKTLAKGKQK